MFTLGLLVNRLETTSDVSHETDDSINSTETIVIKLVMNTLALNKTQLELA